MLGRYFRTVLPLKVSVFNRRREPERAYTCDIERYGHYPTIVNIASCMQRIGAAQAKACETRRTLEGKPCFWLSLWSCDRRG